MTMAGKSMSFKQGQEMKFNVIPESDKSNFALNIGHNVDNYALHLNPKINLGYIMCNSKSGGKWGAEQRKEGCPFSVGYNYKVYIIFGTDGFHIRLPDGNTILFPNRLGDVKYSHIDVSGKARLTGLRIRDLPSAGGV